MCLFSYFGLALFLFNSLPLTSGQSSLICSSEPVEALVGNDVILPCRIEPPVSASTKTVEWTRPGLDPEYIHIHQDGKLIYQNQNPLYSYRTGVFLDQLVNGNVSLKILNVKISDAGKYKCFLHWLWKEAFVQLNVGAVSAPEVSLVGQAQNTKGVIIDCKSRGWFPEPELLWLDSEGNILSAGPTETVRGSDDLYTVSSRVTVEKRHSNNITCRVQQLTLKQAKTTEIYVPDELFLASCSCAAHIAITVLVCAIVFAAGVFVVWKWRQMQTKKVQETEGDKEKTQSQPLMKSKPNPGPEPKKFLKAKETPTPINTTECQELPENRPVVVDEISPDGKFIRLRNNTNKNQILSNFKLQLETKTTTKVYKFPGLILNDSNTVTIWASDAGVKKNPPTDLIWEKQKTWDTGKHLKVSLISPMLEIMDMKTMNSA